MRVLHQSLRKEPRLPVLTVAVLLGMGLLLATLWYVQVVSSQRYLESQKTQSLRTVRQPAVRGKILDRHGAVLAEDRPTYNLNVYLEELRPHFQKEWRRQRPKRPLSREESQSLQTALRFQVISNFVAQSRLRMPLAITPADLEKHLTELRALPLPVVKNLDAAAVARFMERSDAIPGFEIEALPTRHYPSIAAAHLVGHLRRDIPDEDEDEQFNYRLPDYVGQIGLESTQDTALRGRPGTRSMLVNNLGYRQSENIVVPPQPGHHVRLTIDLAIQDAAYKALKDSGSKAGAAVVVDTRNGDLIAITSIPAFDPNQFVPRLDPQLWASYRDADPTPLIFRATQERYPPGSIFKVISGLAALESGVVKTNQVLYSAGYYELGKRKIRDTAPPGDYDFTKAFKHSSNTYFIHHALECGIERIIEMGSQFFLGQRTGLLPRQEVAGQFPSHDTVRRDWYDGDTANLAIGQGRLSVTPLQMAMMTATVANGGTAYWPRLVERITPVDPDAAAQTITHPSGRIRSQLNVAPQNLAAVQHAMWADVHEEGGTGRAVAIEGFAIGGKTGTAEIKGTDGSRDKVTWFISYGPCESPRYAVVVMVESGASGGKTCAPIAKKIYQALIARETAEPGRRAGALARN